MTAERNTPQPIELDAGAILKVIEEGYPDVVRYAMWRVRAEMAEAELARRRSEEEAVDAG